MARCITWSIREINSCGTFTVPEDRLIPSGRRISLRVIILRAHKRSVAAPVVFLTGGPGYGAADEISLAARVLSGVRSTRDIVLIDQRGTGQSNALNCALYDDDNRLQAYLDPSFPIPAVRTCRASLSKRADLTKYTTAIATDDLADALTALGYARVSLFGVSYGSRVALAFMRRHPDRVQSAVLSGVAPPNLVIPIAAERAGARALSNARTSCETDANCHAAIPGPVTHLQAVETGLARAPAHVLLWNWRRMEREEVMITQRAFNEAAWSMLYDPGRARRLLGYVHQAALGDWGPFARAAIAQRRGREAEHSDGMTLSVLCTEDAPRLADRDTGVPSRPEPLGLPLVHELLTACSSWPHGELTPTDTAPVYSSRPVLLLSGGLDPVTPSDWADSAAVGLPHSVRFVDPGAGHVRLDGCTSKVVDGFIQTEGATVLELPCMASWRRLP